MADGVEPSPETLIGPDEILALKVVDFACGSGAFLVQACRYLAAKLVEVWERREAEQPGRALALPEAGRSRGDPSERLLPADPEERLALARRLVADRCPLRRRQEPYGDRDGEALALAGHAAEGPSVRVPRPRHQVGRFVARRHLARSARDFPPLPRARTRAVPPDGPAGRCAYRRQGRDPSVEREAAQARGVCRQRHRG
jgi:hypothetical protein